MGLVARRGGPRTAGTYSAGRRHLLLKVFDVLRLNGQDVMEQPFEWRRTRLEEGVNFADEARGISG